MPLQNGSLCSSLRDLSDRRRGVDGDNGSCERSMGTERGSGLPLKGALVDSVSA